MRQNQYAGFKNDTITQTSLGTFYAYIRGKIRGKYGANESETTNESCRKCVPDRGVCVLSSTIQYKPAHMACVCLSLVTPGEGETTFLCPLSMFHAISWINTD